MNQQSQKITAKATYRPFFFPRYCSVYNQKNELIMKAKYWSFSPTIRYYSDEKCRNFLFSSTFGFWKEKITAFKSKNGDEFYLKCLNPSLSSILFEWELLDRQKGYLLNMKTDSAYDNFSQPSAVKRVSWLAAPKNYTIYDNQQKIMNIKQAMSGPTEVHLECTRSTSTNSRIDDVVVAMLCCWLTLSS